jgi:hypothetical protein
MADWAHKTNIPSFIIHSNIKEVSSAMKEAVALHRFRMLVGDRNTGKTRLMWELMHRSPDFPSPAQTLYVMLPEVTQYRKPRYETASKVTCYAFEQLEIQTRARRPIAKMYKRRAGSERSTRVTDGNFLSTFGSLVRMLNTECKHIKAIIVDRGEYADTSTLRQLYNLHEQTFHRLGIILIVQTAVPEEPDKVLKDAREAIPALADVALPPVVLQTMASPDVFRETIMPKLLGKHNLYAELDDALKPHYTALRTGLYAYTGANWRRIDHVLTLTMNQALDTCGERDENGKRFLTVAGANMVLKALTAPSLEELIEQAYTPAVPPAENTNQQNGASSGDAGEKTDEAPQDQETPQENDSSPGGDEHDVSGTTEGGESSPEDNGPEPGNDEPSDETAADGTSSAATNSELDDALPTDDTDQPESGNHNK